MPRTTKWYHEAAIEYADKAEPRAARLLDQGIDAPSIQKNWIKAFCKKREELAAAPEEKKDADQA